MVGTNTMAAITAIHKIFPFFMFPPLMINYDQIHTLLRGSFSPLHPLP